MIRQCTDSWWCLTVLYGGHGEEILYRVLEWWCMKTWVADCCHLITHLTCPSTLGNFVWILFGWYFGDALDFSGSGFIPFALKMVPWQVNSGGLMWHFLLLITRPFFVTTIMRFEMLLFYSFYYLPQTYRSSWMHMIPGHLFTISSIFNKCERIHDWCTVSMMSYK